MTEMTPTVYLPLIIPALAALAAHPLARRLDPRYATWLLTVSAVTLAACSTAVLGLLTAAGLAQVRPVAALGHWSVEVVRRADPSAWVVAVVAGLALAAVGVAAARSAIRRALGLAAAHRDARYLPGAEDLVVMAGEDADAYALPGRPGRVVVSAGMLAALDRGGRRALVAHERAHLACRHHLFVSATRLAAALNPLLRPLAAAVDYTIERWADERAARVLGDRAVVARAIGRAALVSAHAGPAGAGAGAAMGVTGPAGSMAGPHALSAAGPVPRRVAALLAPPPRRLALVMIAVLAAVVVAGACALDGLRDFHTLIEVAQAARGLTPRG